jgi:ATP-dependent DNA helicase Rep
MKECFVARPDAAVLGDDVRMPEKPSSADAKASGSDRLAALKAMLG